MDNSPLWVWSVIVGVMIAGKFIYRWQATKQLATEQKESKDRKLEEEATTNIIEKPSLL
jgi:hypothetical protein